jgi:hypothetical protein
MKKNGHWLLITMFLIFTGCATVPVYTSKPATHTFQNDVFVGELEPQLASGKDYFDSFRFVFTNTSKADLHIDWENTFYIHNGKKFGGWGAEGWTIEQLLEKEKFPPEPLITVAPGNTLSRIIFPLRLIARSTLAEKTGDDAKISRGIIPEGECGMLLTIRQGDREIREELKFRITITQMQK